NPAADLEKAVAGPAGNHVPVVASYVEGLADMQPPAGGGQPAAGAHAVERVVRIGREREDDAAVHTAAQPRPQMALELRRWVPGANAPTAEQAEVVHVVVRDAEPRQRVARSRPGEAELQGPEREAVKSASRLWAAQRAGGRVQAGDPARGKPVDDIVDPAGQ